MSVKMKDSFHNNYEPHFGGIGNNAFQSQKSLIGLGPFKGDGTLHKKNEKSLKDKIKIR